MKIAIVIPTLNESKIIRTLLDSIILEVGKNTRHTFVIIVVDSKSIDGTSDIVINMTKNYPNIVLLTEERRGLGYAYLHGINYAINELKVDAFMEFDGDYQHDPKDINRLVNKLDEGYDYVIGSRYIMNGSIPKEWPWYRKVLSYLGNLIIRAGLNIKVSDATSGFKLSRVSGFKYKIPLQNKELISYRHAYKIHFLYCMIKGGAKTTEVPIVFLNRSNGISKSTFEDVIESLRVIYVLNIRNLLWIISKNKKRINIKTT